MSGSPAAARIVGNQSRWLTISLDSEPASMCPGKRTRHGTRYAPSQLEFFSLRYGVVPASGHVFMCGPLRLHPLLHVLDAVLDGLQHHEELGEQRLELRAVRDSGEAETLSSLSEH